MKPFAFSRHLIFSLLLFLSICISQSTKAMIVKPGRSILSMNSSNLVRDKINFNYGWQFYKVDNVKSNKDSNVKTMYDISRKDFSSQFLNEYISSGGIASQQIQKEVEKAISDFNDEYPTIASKDWQAICLPHTANIEPLESGINQWEGVCYYRKSFLVPSQYIGKRISIEFEGAMQQSDIWINGKLISQHKGGYTPFSIDLTGVVSNNKSNEIIVRLDNRAGRDFPVGKDLKKMGFNYWSGIYRSVFLHITNPIHITDAVKMNKVCRWRCLFQNPHPYLKNVR